MPTRHFVFLFEIFGYTTTLTEKDHHRVLVDNVEKIHVYSIAHYLYHAIYMKLGCPLKRFLQLKSINFDDVENLDNENMSRLNFI